MTSRSRFVVLGEITRALSRGDNTDEVIRVALEAVATALDADIVSFATPHAAGTLRFVVLEGGTFVTTSFTRDGSGLTETVLDDGKPVLVDDLTEVDVPLRRLVGEDAPHARSYLGVPAISGTRTIGVLSAQSYRSGVYGSDEADLATEVGAQVADVIVSSRRVARIKRRLEDVDRFQRQRTDFLVGVAHDMRSPLSGILGFARILQDLDSVQSDPMAVEAVEFIAAESQRLSDLVAQLVDLGRVDLGDTGLEVEALDLSRLAAQAVDSVRPRFPAHRFVVRTTGPVMVNGDLMRLDRVVTNLLENAAAHGPAAGLVTIEVGRRGSDAELGVSDRGTGVPLAERERIFERFVRLDGSSAGSGVGLYLVRALVEAHGGTIGVEDAPGGGAKFVVRIPIEGPGRDGGRRSAHEL